MNTKNEKTFKLHEIEQSPFCIAEHDGKFTVIMKNYIVSEDFESKEDAEDYIAMKPWKLIVALIGIINETNNETKTK